MVLDLRLTKIGCRDDNQFFYYIHPTETGTALCNTVKRNDTIQRARRICMNMNNQFILGF